MLQCTAADWNNTERFTSSPSSSPSTCIVANCVVDNPSLVGIAIGALAVVLCGAFCTLGCIARCKEDKQRAAQAAAASSEPLLSENDDNVERVV